jgi:hypothetical protein
MKLFWYLGFHGNAIFNFINMPKAPTHYGEYSYYVSWSLMKEIKIVLNYRTEFHETWWSYRYMFLDDPKVFSFVVKGVKIIFWGVINTPKAPTHYGEYSYYVSWSLMKEIKIVFKSMATVAKFVLPIPILLAYLFWFLSSNFMKHSRNIHRSVWELLACW